MNKIITTMLVAFVFTAFTSVADLDAVPLPDDFKPTLQVTDEYPLVQTGYSAQSVADIAAFYISELGKPQLTRGDNSRMTLFYAVGNENIRISLYTNDYKTEIAIMLAK
ncbi:hypothetical protein [Pseudoalteromonas sp. SaAl2]